MAEDLEADPVGEVPASPETSVETPASSEPSTPSALEDQYDFGPPDETPAQPAETPAQPAAQEPVQPSAAPAAAPSLSPALAQRAAAVGYTPEALAAFKDPLAIETAVRTTEQAAATAAYLTQQRFQQAVPQQQQQAPAQLPPRPQAPAAFDETAIRKDLSEKGWDESLINWGIQQAKQNHDNAVANHQAATQLWDQAKFNQEAFRYMQGQDQRIAELNQRHQLELVNRDWDGFVKSQPDQHQKLISDDQTKANIWQMAGVILDGRRNAGLPVPSNSEAFEMAKHAILGPKLYGAAKEEVRQEVRTHQARAVARPSASRTGPAPRMSAVEREASAGNFADEFFRSLNMAPASTSAQPEV